MFTLVSVDAAYLTRKEVRIQARESEIWARINARKAQEKEAASNRELHNLSDTLIDVYIHPKLLSIFSKELRVQLLTYKRFLLTCTVDFLLHDTGVISVSAGKQ